MTGVYWLASYPKSGNTWLRALLRSCLDGGQPVDINKLDIGRMHGRCRDSFDEHIGVSASDLTSDEVLEWSGAALRAKLSHYAQPPITKTHDARLPLPGGDWTIPPDATRAAVYLVRDPRDVAPSLARHLDIDIDAAIRFMGDADTRAAVSKSRLNPQLCQIWASWSRNVESWMAPAPYPVLLISYERLQANTEDTLAEVVRTFGMEFPPEVLKAAVSAVSLERLRAQEAEKGFRETTNDRVFFGEGRVGGWRSKLTNAQRARIEADHGEVMQRLGYIE